MKRLVRKGWGGYNRKQNEGKKVGSKKAKKVGTQEGHEHKLEIREPRKGNKVRKDRAGRPQSLRGKGGGLTAERVSEVREEV